ncbi:MAG: ATP-binding protein [Ruminococcaceae bacterium]|nr:ATP-binding protein [Oscillospiraceae bacterium]
MINVIIGEKGTGKTARLIDAVHNAEKVATGSVVFINKGKRHVLDLSHKVRLVDTEEYGINSYDAFYGFVCGILSQNYDIAHVFVDSITKIVNDDMAALEAFLDKINVVAEQNNAEIQIILSMNPADASDAIKKYVK